MSWTDTDDDQLKESEDKLFEKQHELNAQLIPIRTILSNITQIESKESKFFNGEQKIEITKIKPKDKWGEDMTDEYRLKIKDECITKTNELLGVDNES